VVAPGTDHAKKPIGTGPFRFVEYLPKERLVVERNADYWRDKAKVACPRSPSAATPVR